MCVCVCVCVKRKFFIVLWSKTAGLSYFINKFFSLNFLLFFLYQSSIDREWFKVQHPNAFGHIDPAFLRGVFVFV